MTFLSRTNRPGRNGGCWTRDIRGRKWSLAQAEWLIGGGPGLCFLEYAPCHWGPCDGETFNSLHISVVGLLLIKLLPCIFFSQWVSSYVFRLDAFSSPEEEISKLLCIYPGSSCFWGTVSCTVLLVAFPKAVSSRNRTGQSCVPRESKCSKMSLLHICYWHFHYVH